MNKCRKRTALVLLSSCFLLVSCLFMAEKNVVIKKKKEGLRIEKKEFFAVWVVLFLLQKDGIRSKKRE